TLLGSGSPFTRYSHPWPYGSVSVRVISWLNSGFTPTNSPATTQYRSVNALNPSTHPIVCPTSTAWPAFGSNPNSTKAPSIRVATFVNPTRHTPSASRAHQKCDGVYSRSVGSRVENRERL